MVRGIPGARRRGIKALRALADPFGSTPGSHDGMSDLSSPTAPERGAKRRYRVELLCEAGPTGRGIAYLRDGEPGLLEWGSVQHAVAAEVGEPEGVRTIVFDLLVGEEDGAYRVCRLDAEPGEQARLLAQSLAAALGPERVAGSVSRAAADGVPGRWYPDLESFEAEALESVLG
jgi:hypothetical protein